MGSSIIGIAWKLVRNAESQAYLSHTKSESVLIPLESNPFAATWMKLEIVILSEVSQKEKDKYHMISLICGI